jgi:hypothetical protein
VEITQGQRFGRFTVLDPTGRKVQCRCDCGTERDVDRYSLADGRSTSCGCRNREAAAERARGRVKHPVAVGDVFDRWTVLDAADRSRVHVRCTCGSEARVPASNLVGGLSRSCGCLKRERSAELGRSNRTHGLSRHPLYGTWERMVARCHGPESGDWRYYGARGIKVHPTWFDVAAFIADVERDLGARPEGMTLDRIDNDGHYAPGNVQWATWAEQASSRRPWGSVDR